MAFFSLTHLLGHTFSLSSQSFRFPSCGRKENLPLAFVFCRSCVSVCTNKMDALCDGTAASNYLKYNLLVYCLSCAFVCVCVSTRLPGKSHGPETINLTNGRMEKEEKWNGEKTKQRTDFLIKLRCGFTWKLRSRGVIADHFAIDANVQTHLYISEPK